MLNDLTDGVARTVETLGYLGVAVLVAVENVFPPIPSEVVLPLAGFVAGRGDASLPGMIAAASAGSLVGAWALYALSAAVGPVRLHRFVVRYGRWLRLGEHDLRRAEAWFDRRADAAVFIGRCVPLIRSLVSIPAGFRRMPFARFSALSVAGSVVWNTALIGAGAVLGERWERVGDVVGLMQGALILAVVGLVGLYVWRRVLRPRLAAAGDLPPADPGE
ncbi:MAG: DedA family protein [Acidimicrobiales bacterium]